MKKTILIIVTLGLLSLTVPNKRQYVLTEGEAIMTFQLLEKFQQVLPTSDALSMKEGVSMNYWMDSIKGVIEKQYHNYNDTAKNKH